MHQGCLPGSDAGLALNREQGACVSSSGQGAVLLTTHSWVLVVPGLSCKVL